MSSNETKLNNQNDNGSCLMTPHQVAEIHPGLSPHRLAWLTNHGYIPVIKVPGNKTQLYDLKDIQNFIEKYKNSGGNYEKQ